MTGETPGKLKRNPSAARSICAALCVAAALTFGSRWLNSCHLAPRAARELSPASSNPRLLRNARSIASLIESCSTPPVAFPSGTLPRKEFCVDPRVGAEYEPAADPDAELRDSAESVDAS